MLLRPYPVLEKLPSNTSEAPALAATRKRLGELEARVHDLDSRVQDMEVLREQAVSETDELRASCERLEEQLSAARRELQAVTLLAESRRAENEELHTILDEAHDTLGWRITRPLRALTTRYPGLGDALETLVAFAWAVVRFRFRVGLRRRRAIRTIRRSGLFDRDHYLAHQRDVAGAGIDPIDHYLTCGAAAGHDPHPWFSTRFYLDENPDVRAAGMNPLLHYIEHGGLEGRPPNPSFDGEAYLRANPDVAAARMNPLVHYLVHGRHEGRAAAPIGSPAPAAAEAIDLLQWLRGVRPPPEHGGAVLIADHRLPMPDQDSGSVRMLAIVKLFRELDYDVTFVSDDEAKHPGYEGALRDLGVEVLHGLDSTRQHLQQRGASYALVILSRPSISERYMTLARAWAVFADVVYDTVDLHWVRLSRAADLLGDAGLARSAEDHHRLESLAITSSDLVFAITDTEKQAVLDQWPHASVGVIPNIHACRPLPRPWSERRDLMFIGGYAHPPNVDAVAWFATEVLPLVARELPGIRFKMVGSQPPESLRALVSSSVELVGYVRDPETCFDEARVFVAPLRYGAGMKGKIGQAMSFGLPVVTTSIGAEGMLLEDGAHALIADSAQEFAAAVIRLYTDQDLWEGVRVRALTHIERNFSEAAVGEALKKMFAASAPKPRRSQGVLPTS